MKVIQIYVCKICGRRYDFEQEAKDCEKSHKRTDKIVRTKYTNKYPDTLLVRMEDGEEIPYVRSTESRLKLF